MSRYELLQAFYKIARVLFLDSAETAETLRRVKMIVLDVLTENGHDTPLKFGAGDDESIGGK